MVSSCRKRNTNIMEPITYHQSFFLLTFLACGIESANILGIFPYTARSHFAIYAPLLDEIWSRGHNLTVISHFPLTLGEGRPGKLGAQASVSDSGPGRLEKSQGVTRERYLDVSLIGTTPSLHGNLSMDGLNSAPLGLFDNIRQVFDGLKDYEAMLSSSPMRQFLAKDSTYDLIIIELFNTDVFLPIVHRFGAPYIAISPWPLTPWARFRVGDPADPSTVPNSFGPFGVTLPMNLPTRAWNALYHTAFSAYYNLIVEPSAQQTARKIFPDAPPLDRIAANVSLLLVNTHGSLHRPPNTSPRIVEIGGLHLGHQDLKERLEIHSWLDQYSDRGTILFSLGSMFNAGSIPEGKRAIFRNVLKQLPHLVIWKMALPPGANRTDGNILYWNWVPQEIVLGHKSVKLFIYHGGLLGVLEAVSSGVPILGLPMFGDMASNMAAIESSGAGLALPYRNLTEKLLYDTITTMISDIRYKTNAMRLSEVFNDRPIRPLDLAVYWCEYVIKHGGASYLRTHALAWYQVWFLDIIFILVAFLATVTLIPFLLIKRLFFIYLVQHRKSKEL